MKVRCFERVLTEVIIPYLSRADQYRFPYFYAQNFVREAMPGPVTSQPLGVFIPHSTLSFWFWEKMNISVAAKERFDGSVRSFGPLPQSAPASTVTVRFIPGTSVLVIWNVPAVLKTTSFV